MLEGKGAPALDAAQREGRLAAGILPADLFPVFPADPGDLGIDGAGIRAVGQEDDELITAQTDCEIPGLQTAASFSATLCRIRSPPDVHSVCLWYPDH